MASSNHHNRTIVRLKDLGCRPSAARAAPPPAGQSSGPTTGPFLSALTIAEVAAELRCGTTTVRRLIDEGRLRAVRVGKTKYVVLTRDLLAFANGDEART